MQLHTLVEIITPQEVKKKIAKGKKLNAIQARVHSCTTCISSVPHTTNYTTSTQWLLYSAFYIVASVHALIHTYCI